MTSTLADKLVALTASVSLPGTTVALVAQLIEEARSNEVVIISGESDAWLVRIEDLVDVLRTYSTVVTLVLP